MMPLKKEVQAVAALLEQGAESPEALATAVIKALDEARATRVTYTAVLRFGNGKSTFMQGFAPFSTKNQAIKAIEKHPAAPMATAMAIVPVVNDLGLDELIARVDEPAVTRGDFAEVRKDAEAKRNGWDGKGVSRDRYLA